MVSKILIFVCAAVVIIHTVAAIDSLSEEVHYRLKRQQPPSFTSLLKEPFDKIAQAGNNPLSQFQKGAAEFAKNFPQPPRFKRHDPFKPVFSLFGDHFSRVAKTFENLAGKDSSSSTSTTTTSTTTTTTEKSNK